MYISFVVVVVGYTYTFYKLSIKIIYKRKAKKEKSIRIYTKYFNESFFLYVLRPCLNVYEFIRITIYVFYLKMVFSI